MMKKTIKNKNQKKEATTDDIVTAIGNLSEKMDKRFFEVNDRFKKQEIKLEKIMDNKIEEFALIVNRSFETLATKNDTNLLKEGISELTEEMNEKFNKVNNSVEKISIHMDNLADVVYADHRPRIINLEKITHKLESKI